jgi:hypothetical protein
MRLIVACREVDVAFLELKLLSVESRIPLGGATGGTRGPSLWNFGVTCS